MSDNIQSSNVDLLLDLGSSSPVENNMATKLNGTSHTDMNDSTNKEFDDLLDFDSKPDTKIEDEWKYRNDVEKFANDFVNEALEESREKLSPEREVECVQDQKPDLFNQNDFGAETIKEEEINEIKERDVPVTEEDLIKVDNNSQIEKEVDQGFTVQEEVIEAHERVEQVYEPTPSDNSENLFEKQPANEAEPIQLNSIVPSESLTSDLSEGIVLRNNEFVEENEGRIDEYEGDEGDEDGDDDDDDDDDDQKEDNQTPSVSLVQDLTAPEVEEEQSSPSVDQFEVNNDQNMDCTEDSYGNKEEKEDVIVNGNSVKEWKTTDSHIENDKNENEKNEPKPKFVDSPKIVRKQETPKAFSNLDNSMTSQANPTCFSCSKRVYPVELKQIDGLTFHKQCFRCSVCKCALTNNFSKLEKSFYCKPHYREIFTRKGKYEVESIPQPVNDARAENDERQTAREQIELVQQQKKENVEIEEANGKLDKDEASRTPKTERIADELPKSGSVSSLLSAWKNRSSDQSPSTPAVRPNFTRQEKKKSIPAVVVENNIQNSEPEIKEEKNNHEETDSSSYIRSSVSNTEKDELKNIPLPSARSLRSLFEKGGETKPVEKKVSVTRRFSTEKKKELIITSEEEANDEDKSKSNGTTHNLDDIDSKDGTPCRLTPDEEQPVKANNAEDGLYEWN